MQEGRRSFVRCPQCSGRVHISMLLFRKDSRCIRCRVPLHVSPAYSRALVLLSAFTSIVLLWELGIRDLRFFLFYLPVGFLVLTIMVRVAPFVVAPRLYVGKLTATTTLDLSEDSSTSFPDEKVR
jgi:hypothetical protein